MGVGEQGGRHQHGEHQTQGGAPAPHEGEDQAAEGDGRQANQDGAARQHGEGRGMALADREVERPHARDQMGEEIPFPAPVGWEADHALAFGQVPRDLRERWRHQHRHRQQGKRGPGHQTGYRWPRRGRFGMTNDG